MLITAFVGTAIAFACFSGAALVSKRREYLYLGGLLSSGLSILVWLQFASSLFGQSAAGFKIEDTQEIIERASRGELDYGKHALTLFTDFLAVFVRILNIMLKNASEKSEDKRRKKKS
ncbi:bax inhibitor 1-like [Zingiber officinale]|uniref:Uncharacterized protein n=1 Tax=Zingiber officinale TaxID=94328 RepID=A0A8J5HK10_ZINOF|nr:bax inhibitor 1-like [Zingiber officinale]KAG6526227.1 hypothetical protein ZIOFF_016209 [Zingiber officinale]